MLQKLKTKSQGFTIIEVMIVLAVAALIILIVLLAVPALQRSSRNTTIKSDASSVASGISTFEDNNDGTIPTGVDGTGTVTLTDGNAADTETIKVQGSTVVTTVSSAPTSSSLQPGNVAVMLKVTCDGTSNTRAASVYYVTENGGGNNKLQCIDT